jgi:hypothetical protein
VQRGTVTSAFLICSILNADGIMGKQQLSWRIWHVYTVILFWNVVAWKLLLVKDWINLSTTNVNIKVKSIFRANPVTGLVPNGLWDIKNLYTFSSQTAMRLWALRAGRLYLQEDTWYSHLFEAE